MMRLMGVMLSAVAATAVIHEFEDETLSLLQLRASSKVLAEESAEPYSIGWGATSRHTRDGGTKFSFIDVGKGRLTTGGKITRVKFYAHGNNDNPITDFKFRVFRKTPPEDGDRTDADYWTTVAESEPMNNVNRGGVNDVTLQQPIEFDPGDVFGWYHFSPGVISYDMGDDNTADHSVNAPAKDGSHMIWHMNDCDRVCNVGQRFPVYEWAGNARQYSYEAFIEPDDRVLQDESAATGDPHLQPLKGEKADMCCHAGHCEPCQ